MEAKPSGINVTLVSSVEEKGKAFDSDLVVN